MIKDINKLCFLPGSLLPLKDGKYPYITLLKQGLTNLGIIYPQVSTGDLPVADILQGDEVVETLQDGNLVKTTVQDIADLAGVGNIVAPFEALVGNAWDVSTQPKVTKTISANTTLTVTGEESGKGYLLYINQGGSGSYTLSINGTDVDINDTGTTLVGMMSINSDLAFSTNKGQLAAGPYTDVVFDNLQDMSQYQPKRWRSGGINGGWMSGGLDSNNNILANEDFILIRKFITGEGMFSYLGLYTTENNPLHTQPLMLIGISAGDAADGTSVVKLENTTQTGISASLTNGGWFGIRRLGSTWTFVQSADGESFTTLGTSSVTSTAAVYFVAQAYVNAAAIIDTPKYRLL